MRLPSQLIAIVLAMAPLSAGQSRRCEALPADAKVLLNQRFQNWRPKEASDLSGDDKKLWLEMHPKECPGIAVGHFEQRDRDAYALLLVPRTADNDGYKIIVLSKGPDGYAVRLLDHAEGNPYSGSGLVISRQPSGTYSDFDTSKSVRLTLNGVNVEWLEKSSLLYYWSEGKYQSIQTSD